MFSKAFKAARVLSHVVAITLLINSFGPAAIPQGSHGISGAVAARGYYCEVNL